MTTPILVYLCWLSLAAPAATPHPVSRPTSHPTSRPWHHTLSVSGAHTSQALSQGRRNNTGSPQRHRSPTTVLTRKKPASPPSRWQHAISIYEKKGCHLCHTLDGTDSLGPSLLGLYNTQAILHNGRKILRNKAYYFAKIQDSSALELEGNRNVMPIYRDGLTSSELQTLVDWLITLQSPTSRSSVPSVPRSNFRP